MSDAGIIIELKYSKTYSGLNNACEKAINQIKERRYQEYLKNDGREDILIYGIAFCKKKCKVNVERLSKQEEKAARNTEYFAVVDRGIAQLSAGKGQEHELLEGDE